MPKKFKGENSKAAVAKARKADALNEKLAAIQKAEEDAFWEDDNKHIKRKQQRKENKDKKREDELSRKLEARRLLEEEELTTKASIAKTVKPVKLTAAQIRADRETIASQEAAEIGKEKAPTSLDAPLEENPNIALAELEASGQTVARNIEDAIGALSMNNPAVDKHPERRVKAAYNAFEEVHLPRLRAENPTLRLSQLKQMLKKDWARSSDNPLNQRTTKFTA